MSTKRLNTFLAGVSSVFIITVVISVLDMVGKTIPSSTPDIWSLVETLLFFAAWSVTSINIYNFIRGES